MKITGYMIAHAKEDGYIATTHCPERDKLDKLIERGIIGQPYVAFDYDNFENPADLIICDEDPTSNFFNCWQFDHPETPTKVVVDLEKAKDEWFQHLKSVRDSRLQYLDSLMVRAMGQGDQERIQQLEEIKQTLRDLPSYVDFSIVEKPSDLFDVYPAVLLAE